MAAIDRYRRLEDLPTQLPVFPLRGVILLPRALLPLHVFEPRYLAMMDAVLARDRVIGILQPAPLEGPPRESPAGRAVALRSVGCVGRLTAFQELDDGRMLVTVAGIARFTLGEECETTAPYRVFNVSYDRFAGDLDRDAGTKAIDRDALLAALKSYLESHRLAADWTAIERSDTETLVNALSVISPFEPEEKQALLEAADLEARTKVLIALAQMELAGGGHGGGAGGTLQ